MAKLISYALGASNLASVRGPLSPLHVQQAFKHFRYSSMTEGARLPRRLA